jgi:hypothetical protein
MSHSFRCSQVRENGVTGVEGVRRTRLGEAGPAVGSARWRRRAKYPLDKTGVYALLSHRGPVVNRRGRRASNRRGPARP